jgi:hypothetical protein
MCGPSSSISELVAAVDACQVDDRIHRHTDVPTSPIFAIKPLENLHSNGNEHPKYENDDRCDDDPLDNDGDTDKELLRFTRSRAVATVRARIGLVRDLLSAFRTTDERHLLPWCRVDDTTCDGLLGLPHPAICAV